MPSKKMFALFAACFAVIAGSMVALGAFREKDAGQPAARAANMRDESGQTPKARAAMQTAIPAKTAACAVTEAALTSGWIAAGVQGEYEQIAFAIEDGQRVFRTWLHERPEITDGRWTLSGCVLTMNATAAGVNQERFVLAMPEPDILTMAAQDESENSSSTLLRYARVKN